jgi:hypothetical protein
MHENTEERREQLRTVPLETLLELMGKECDCPKPKKKGKKAAAEEPGCTGKCDWALAQREMKARNRHLSQGGIVTAFWDEKRREVRDLDDLAKREGWSEDKFVEAVVGLERQVIQVVSFVTGDRDFPNDLRELIQKKVAIDAVHALPEIAPNSEAREWLVSMRYSRLFEELHSAFHEVARRRPKHRFEGAFSDDPSGFLRIRDEALKEQEREQAWALREARAFGAHDEDEGP